MEKVGVRAIALVATKSSSDVQATYQNIHQQHCRDGCDGNTEPNNNNTELSSRLTRNTPLETGRLL